MAALDTLYTPADALDFHRRLLPEMFGTVGRTPKGMTAAAREQRNAAMVSYGPGAQERTGREKNASYVAVGELGGAITGEWPA